MTTKEYYIKELNTLRIDGADFARKNPGLSSYLAKEGQDPDVERILEGFAFLTGKLHQKFDKELPEVAHNLVQLLWPNYIRPIPSYTIIQFDALQNTTKNSSLKKGLPLLSKPAEDGLVCKFHTCLDTEVLPIKLEHVDYMTFGHKSSLELIFSLSISGTLADVSFEKLRLYLGGSKFMAKELYLYLDRYVEKIELLIKSKDNLEIIENIMMPINSIRPVGFDASQTVLPYKRNTFDGYVMLQEYFCYQDKYLFVDIENLDIFSNLNTNLLKQSSQFSIKFHLSKTLTTVQQPTLDDFRLFCTPAVNLFESDAVPIRKTHMEDEYLLAPSELKKEQSEVFSIDSVRGWVPSKNIYQDYTPFESFEHTQEGDEYYSELVKLNDTENKTETFLRFASSGGIFNDLDHNNATVSVKMTCTNKDMPSKLHLGDICVNDPLSSSELNFKNITIPTISYPPPLHGDFLWKLISNMSLNYLSLNNITTLRMILQTYDFFGANDEKQKEKTDVILSGLKEIKNHKTQMIYEGFAIRGIETQLYVDPTKFTSIGEVYHLCCVLNEFFALFCSVNSFHQLIVHVENYESFTWKPKMGYQTLV